MGYLYEIKNLNIRTDDMTFNNTLYNICAQNGPIILSEKEFYCKNKLRQNKTYVRGNERWLLFSF